MDSQGSNDNPDGDARQPNWIIRRGDPRSGVIIHVPHASRAIPAGELKRIRLRDEDLRDELDAMTDADTERLAEAAADMCSDQRPWIFENRFSRLLVDPERFPDEREEMLKVGMGPVYLSTSDGRELRKPDPADDRRLMKTYFEPYADALEQLVRERLEETGEVLIIDLHSFPIDPLPYERPDQARPSLCLGTDPFHTPDRVAQHVSREWHGSSSFSFEYDQPFSGTYVPLAFYETDRRVSSLMFEFRRDLVADWVSGTRSNEPVELMPAVIAGVARRFAAGQSGPAD